MGGGWVFRAGFGARFRSCVFKEAKDPSPTISSFQLGDASLDGVRAELHGTGTRV